MMDLYKKERRKMKGLGFRHYKTITNFCPLCNTSRNLVFVLGWGNYMRCDICLFKLSNRKDVVFKGLLYNYMRGNKLIRDGIE
jgi:hypothetical protein